MISAVLERVLNLNLSNQDIYASVAGGVRVGEPAVDLAVALAITSCYRKKAVPAQLAVIGEVGLTGEVRGVNQIIARVMEAQKIGFKKIMVPKANLKEVEAIKNKLFQGTEVIGVANLKETLETALG
jgi:DNA repair protein RadA/Sms